MKISCQEGLAPGARFEEKWQFLERVGFDGVEINGEFDDLGDRKEEIVQLCSRSPVKASTICGTAQGCLLASHRQERDRAAADIKRLLQISSEIGARGVVFAPLAAMVMGWTSSPRIPDLSPLYSRTELESSLLVRLLVDIAHFAENTKTTLLLEPVNRFQTHWPTTVEETLRICSAVHSPNLKMVVDLFHMNIEEKDPLQSIRMAGDHLGHVHVCDSNRRLPGKGHIDFGSVIGALKDIGYEGYLALECQLFDESAEEELPRCLEFLRKQL
jgi:sugar phosphate isomerase/epimerase